MAVFQYIYLVNDWNWSLQCHYDTPKDVYQLPMNEFVSSFILFLFSLSSCSSALVGSHGTYLLRLCPAEIKESEGKKYRSKTDNAVHTKQENRSFYSCVLSCQAFDLEWGWRWPVSS